MNSTPIILPAVDSELARLVESICDGTIAPAERDRLESLLTDDRDAKLYYVACLDMHAQMQWITRGEGQGAVDSPAIDGEAGFGVRDSGFGIQGSESLSVGAEVELPHQPESQTPSPEPPFPTLSTTNYPLPTAPFVGSWAFSYMVATVVMGVAILGFWAYKITHHQHIAEAPSQSVPSEAMQEMVFVGRITGMVDVKWSDDPHYLPPLGFAHVPLGRKYILSSGLLEITYDSGAKVILEGPCTYEVESTAGGYLSLGKLTARVGGDKETKRQGDKEKKADAASPHLLVSRSPGLPVSPLFSVRTPTALITDLGTEFGVKVDENGDVATHVLEGKVEFKVLGDGQRENQTILVSVGESVLLAKGKDGQAATVSLGKANAAAFPIHPGKLAEYVQEQREAPFRRWQAYSQKLSRDPSLVAYYTFETRGREATNAGAILPNVALTGEALDGRIDGPRWAEGRFRGKFALRFTGPNWRDRVELPEPERFNFTGAFTVAVWFQIERFTAKHQALIAKGDKAWRMQRFSDLENLGFSTNSENRTKHEIKGSGEVANRQWHLAVAVWAPIDGKASKRLYLDGRLDVEGQSPLPLNHNDDPVWLGNNSTYPDRTWDGLIDEVAIFSRALPGKEIEEMFAAGNPPESDKLTRDTGETPAPPGGKEVKP